MNVMLTGVNRVVRAVVGLSLILLSAPTLQAASFPSPKDWREENIYQIYTDRFFDGDPANNVAETNRGLAFLPADSRGVHGGDLKGIQQKLDYIKSIGATAIWIGPIPMNDVNGDSSGYRATDFYKLAPHLGTLTDLTNMVAAAHARGIKVVLDVVVNHSGNLIHSTDAGYPNFKYPATYTLSYINPANQQASPFNVTNVSPPNLNVIFHGNGVTQNYDDNNQVEKGEISNLDDFNTDSTFVRTNMANIYKYWIQTADLDGFRIDTVKHVEHGNTGFWSYWCPEIHNFATSIGKTNFFMFGEVFAGSDAKNGSYTGTKGSSGFAMDATVDYPLYFTINPVFAQAVANTQQIEDHFNAIAGNYDPVAWYRLVTFLDNHDNPRFLSSNNANNNTTRLGTALDFLYTARGIPCLYYGTEQAFNGGGDPYNREDMMDGQFEYGPSDGDNFNETHPLFRQVAMLNNFRRNYIALRLGDHVNQWASAGGPGLFAYSRRYQTQEVFAVFTPASVSQTLPPRGTIYPAGTQLVNLLNTNEIITVDGAQNTPSLTLNSFEMKIFVARSQYRPLDPVVVSLSPSHAMVNVSNGAPIVVHFSKPMNTNSVQAAFSLQPSTAGTFSWSASHDTMTFTPGFGGFPLSTTTTLRIGTNAVDAVDGNAFYAPFEDFFVTSATPSTDTTPPGLALGNPANGSVVTGLVVVSGTASDNVAVTNVQVQLDGGTWVSATGTTTWALSLNTMNFLNGTHTLAARATDASGNVSSNPTVTVRFFNVPGAYVQRISAGNPGNVTDCSNRVWAADQAYSLGGFGYDLGSVNFISNTIAGVCTNAQPLYQHERLGSFRYLFDCPAGVYETTLLEAETYWTGPNQRVFHVFVEGQPALVNFDIFAAAGGANVPVTQTFTTTVSDAQLELQFTPVTDNARASGIQVRKIADLDSDGDGIPDWWTLGYFDHPTGQAGDLSQAGDDPDGDGLTNLQEFLAGSNPTVNPYPAAPSNLIATNIYENQIGLSWHDNSTNELAFVIQRALSGSGPWTQIASVGAGVTNLIDCSVVGGTVYFYQVLATNAVAASTPSNVAQITTPTTNNVIAFDRTSEAAYGGGWTNGSNGGFGFGPWRLVNTAVGGFFLGTSANNGPNGGVTIDSCGESFGIYANSGGNAVAYRSLGGTPLAVGQSLRWRMDNGWIDNGKSVGLVLRTGNATNTVGDYNNGARFEFLFIGGTNNYSVVDAAGLRDTGVGYSTEAVELEFTLTGADAYALRIARLANGTVATMTGTLGGVSGGTVDSFAAYNRNAGSGAAFDVLFNYFRRLNTSLDADGDGMPDAWETLYGLNPVVSNALDANADSDWMTDLEEYIADTNPTNGASYFPLVQLTNGPTSDTMSIVVNPTSTGRLYDVRWSTNLPVAPQTWLPYGSVRTGTGAGISFTVTNDASFRFYRAGVQLP